jgi:hypothetical protein
MECWVWESFAFVVVFVLFGIGTWVSLIGGFKQWRTNSATEGILLIVVGASIVSLSGLMAAVVSNLLRH